MIPGPLFRFTRPIHRPRAADETMTLPQPSIRSLLLILVAATGLPLVGLLAYTVYVDTERAIAQEKNTVYSLATVFAANVSRIMATNQAALDRISKRPRVLAVDEHQCDPIFNDFRTLFPAFANIASIDLSGRIVCSAVEQPGGKPISIAHTEWFKRAMAERRFIVGNPFVGPITGRWVSVLVNPIYDDVNALKGFMALPLDLAAYDPKISAAPITPATRYGIISTDGILIWRNEDPEKLIGTNVRGFEAVDKMLATKDGVYEARGADGTARVYAAAPVPEANWYVFVGIPSRPLYVDAFQRAIRNSALALGFLLGIAGLTIYIAHRRIALPVLALVSGVKAIKDGRYDARVNVGSGEVAEVAAEFNQMAESWQAAERQLRELNLHLEERIHARTTELEEANRELSAFSYSVSHDLRAPLRAIDGFCHVLLEDYGERLDDTGRSYLNRVRKASQHMAEIIDDMLGMARSMRDEMHCRIFDFSAMARTVIADVTSSSPRDGVEWKLADGIMAFGDENLLGVVLQNLLGNAYKYTSKHASASIEFGVLPEKQDGSAVYFVKDDGVGFDMSHSGKLFGVFQRLHRDDDFDGHGIGLATVHRVVQRHGGKTWAEGAVEQGATFYFTLPDPEKSKVEACMGCVEPACDAREGEQRVSAAG